MSEKLVRRKLKRQLCRRVSAALHRKYSALANYRFIPFRWVNLLEIHVQDETLLYLALALIVPVLREPALRDLRVVSRDAVLELDADLRKVAEEVHAF